MGIYNAIHRRKIRIKVFFCTFWAKITLPLKGKCTIGENLRVRGRIFVSNYGEIKIGNNVTINSADWSNPIGAGSKTYFQVAPSGYIKIGDNSGVSNIAITSQIGVEIGNNVLLGSGVKIYDTDFHPIIASYRYGSKKDDSKTMCKKVVIEDGAFIGAGSFILKGSRVGKNSVVGAGSVVSGIIPDNEIWGGAPARFIKKAISLEE